MSLFCTIVAMEAHTQFIAEPFEAKKISRETHEATVRSFVAALTKLRLAA